MRFVSRGVYDAVTTTLLGCLILSDGQVWWRGGLLVHCAWCAKVINIEVRIWKLGQIYGMVAGGRGW